MQSKYPIRRYKITRRNIIEDILYFNIGKYTKHIKDGVAAFAVKDMKVPDNFLEETYDLMPHFSIVRYGHGVGI
jgi:hypothetical protein